MTEWLAKPPLLDSESYRSKPPIQGCLCETPWFGIPPECPVHQKCPRCDGGGKKTEMEAIILGSPSLIPPVSADAEKPPEIETVEDATGYSGA